jgi:hypothetical protein
VKNDIKMDLGEKGLGGVDSIHLAQVGTSDRHSDSIKSWKSHDSVPEVRACG